jgi:hypothetical protein
MLEGEDQKRPTGLTKATQLKVSKLLTLITHSRPSSPKMMFSFDINRVRLEDHLRSPVAIPRSWSTKSPPSLLPAKSKPRARGSNRLNTGVSTKRVKLVPSHLLKSGVSKNHSIKAIWPPWGNHSQLVGVVQHHKKGCVVHSPSETQNCDPSHTRIDHEVESVQQPQHHQT